MNKARGFTLMELVVVLAIAAVIIGIGTPSFNRFRQNARLTNTANDVLALVVKARNEAIKRQRNISICASSNPDAATPGCTDGATAGLILFEDLNGDCLRNGLDVALGSVALDHTMATIPMHVRTDGNCLSFAETGFRRDAPSRTSVSRLLYCDNRGKDAIEGGNQSAARGILLARTGRAKITRDRTTGTTEDITTWTGTLECP